MSHCPLLSQRLVFIEGQGGESQTVAVAAVITTLTFLTKIFVCSHGVCATVHQSAKGEKLKIRVTSAKQKEDCDKSSSSLFILIKQDSADITQEVSNPHGDTMMTFPALQCKDEEWRHGVSLSMPCSLQKPLSHLHWRQYDTLPAQVQTCFSPLAGCVLGIALHLTMRDPKQGLCKSTNPLIDPLSPLRKL